MSEYTDKSARFGNTYHYRISAIDTLGQVGTPSDPLEVNVKLTTFWQASLTPEQARILVDQESSGHTGYCARVPKTFDKCVADVTLLPFGSIRGNENYFWYGGNRYTVTSLRYRSDGDGSLYLNLDRTLPDSELNNLVLRIGSRAFLLSEAASGNNEAFRWNNLSQPWTVGTAVEVELANPR